MSEKEDGKYKISTFVQSDSSETENDVYFTTDKTAQPQWKINHGFDDDEQYTKGKEIKRKKLSHEKNNSGNEDERLENKGFSSRPSDKGMGPTDDFIRNNIGYYGHAKYFVDDEEDTRMFTVVNEDNWTLRNPDHAPPLIGGTKYIADGGENVSQYFDQTLSSNLKSTTDGYHRNLGLQSKNSKFVKEKSATEYKSDANTDNGFNQYSDGDNDYDDVAKADSTAADDREIHEDDIKDVLGGFDYLDKLGENNDDDVNNALSGFNYLDDLDEIHEDGIKDALSNFEYLEDWDEHSSTKSSTVPHSVSRDQSHDSGHGQKINNLDQEKGAPVINKHEDGLRQKPYSLDERSIGSTHVKNRIFDEDRLEFDNHNLNTFAGATFENNGKIEKPNKLYKSHGVKDTYVQMLPEIHRSNVYDMDKKATGLVERTKSEEMISSFTSGEFILRRTQSEDIQHQNAGTKLKKSAGLEPLPEDSDSISTESTVNVQKRSSDTVHSNICSFMLKGLMVVVFGIATTKITLGIVFMDTCEVEEIVPVCVIASGVVSFCYCITFFGINLLRQRSGKISRIFRTYLVIMWTVLLGLIISGCVLLYPSIQEYAFSECGVTENCCSRKLTLTAFCAIITDLMCQFCFVIILCCVK